VNHKILGRDGRLLQFITRSKNPVLDDPETLNWMLI